MDLPKTTERVELNTPPELNRRIHQDMVCRLHYYAGHRDEIDQRLEELDREWDMERALETNASSLVLLGVLLGLIKRKYLLLPLAVAGFLLQHALQGWCPPVRLFRRMGLRTQSEIEAERYALKALRGDFQGQEVGADDVPQLLRVVGA